jgi:hypothetical protein
MISKALYNREIYRYKSASLHGAGTTSRRTYKCGGD